MCLWRAVTFTPVWDSELHPLTFLPHLVNGYKNLPIVELTCISGSCYMYFIYVYVYVCVQPRDGTSVEDRSQGLNSGPQVF